MAQLKITSKLEGLSPTQAAQYAARYPYKDSGPQRDGDPYDPAALDLTRRTLITPDDKLWSVPGGATAWSDPRTVPVVESWQKRHALGVRKARDGWKANIRGKADDREGPEYDRMMFSLSKAEAAELGPEGVQQVFREFIEAVRESPYGGKRMVEIEPVHEDTDHLHLHVMVHRHGYDVAARTIARTVWQPEIHSKEAARIAEAIQAPISVEYIAPGAAGAQASDEARAEVADLLRSSGAEPSPDLTGEGRHAVRQALPDADEAQVDDALRDLEREMARVQQEQQERAALYAKLQHSKSVFRQAAELREELAAERTAKAAVEGELAETRSTLEATAADLVTERERADQAEGLAAREGARAEAAETLAAERFGEIEDLNGKLQAEAEARAEVEAELTGVREELVGVREDLARESARAEAAEGLAAERGRELDALRAELSAEREQRQAEREAAEATLAAERASLQERVTQAVAEAVARVRAEAAEQMAALRSEFQATLTSIRESYEGMIASMRGAIGQRQPEAPAAAQERDPSRFYERTPSQWTPAEREAAEVKRQEAVEAGKLAPDATVEDYGARAHDAWRKREQRAAGAQQGDAPEGGSKPRKPR